MGVYCTWAHRRRHPAKEGEIMEVRRLANYYGDVVEVLVGDNEEIACIPHKGCRLEIVATAETSHREVNLLLPGQVLRYKRSFWFGDRLELPTGTKVGLPELAGFKLQLAPRIVTGPPAEEAIVKKAAEVTREHVGLR